MNKSSFILYNFLQPIFRSGSSENYRNRWKTLFREEKNSKSFRLSLTLTSVEINYAKALFSAREHSTLIISFSVIKRNYYAIMYAGRRRIVLLLPLIIAPRERNHKLRQQQFSFYRKMSKEKHTKPEMVSEIIKHKALLSYSPSTNVCVI